MRLRCFHCGKSVSTEIPEDTLVRGIVDCPECIEKYASTRDPRGLASFLARRIMYLGDEPGKPATRIQYKLGTYPNEESAGGLNERALASFIRDSLIKFYEPTSPTPSECAPAPSEPPSVDQP